jgi:hypothetical protein
MRDSPKSKLGGTSVSPFYYKPTKKMLKNVIEALEKQKIEELTKLQGESLTQGYFDKHLVVHDDFKPKEVEVKTDLISEGFGISEERGKFLNKVVEETARAKIGTIVKTMETMCKSALHPNEVAYLCFKYGILIGNNKPSGIGGLLSSILGGGGDD